MFSWIILAVVIYLIVGVAVLVYGVVSDPYGGFILHFWWAVILFYPYMIVRSLLDR